MNEVWLIEQRICRPGEEPTDWVAILDQVFFEPSMARVEEIYQPFTAESGIVCEYRVIPYRRVEPKSLTIREQSRKEGWNPNP